jgi:hypothetical protein
MRHRKGEDVTRPATGGSADDRARSDGQARRGAQDHAEGDHGPKTRAHLIEQMHARPPEEPREAINERKRREAGFQGKRRLVENRTQHDEAELNSERKRIFQSYLRGEVREGPADNSQKIHGVQGHREHRADYRLRGPDGLRVNRQKKK